MAVVAKYVVTNGRHDLSWDVKSTFRDCGMRCCAVVAMVFNACHHSSPSGCNRYGQSRTGLWPRSRDAKIGGGDHCGPRVRDSGHGALVDQEADREPNAPLNRLAPLYVLASLPESIGPEVLSYEAALVESARTPIVVQAPARTCEFAGCGWAIIVSIRSCASCFSS
jgi:hypothetical protein